jgi:hypothetical protein
MPHGDYAKELEAYVKGAGVPARRHRLGYPQRC